MNEIKLICHIPIPCCADCSYFRLNIPVHDQPYPKFWCKKGVRDIITDFDQLYEEIECINFKKMV